MSKLRQQLEIPTDDLADPAEGDLQPWVIFTQLKSGGPHVFAGWVDAAGPEMALQFGIEHYGQDQVCVNLWAIPRAFIGGMRMNLEASREPVAEREYQIFTQQKSGDQHLSSIVVRSTCAHDAIELARDQIKGAASMHNLWAVPCDEIQATQPDDVIWRTTDQSYRLARGYARDVREKWVRIRTREDYEEYERESLKESF